ncbi:MAG TPA: hypothetical protein VGE41_10675 [Verrucomicrobiae bacterium]|jgi:hypothetical protein
MEKTHIISWIAIQDQRTGAGKKLMSKDEAETLAAELNEEHPGFLHIPVDTISEDVAETLARAKERATTPALPSNVIPLPELAAEEAATCEAVEV